MKLFLVLLLSVFIVLARSPAGACQLQLISCCTIGSSVPNGDAEIYLQLPGPITLKESAYIIVLMNLADVNSLT